MCVLFTRVSGDLVFMGGASLVSSNQLITLATGVHKFRNTSLQEAPRSCEEEQRVRQEILVKCGDVHLQSKEETTTSQTRSVSRIVVHPDYNTKALTNDLAVLVVSPPFDFSPTVGRVCLPMPAEQVEAGTECVATGHGRDAFQTGYYSAELRRVNLPIVDSATCEETLNEEFFEAKGVLNWKIDPSFLCAGGNNASGIFVDTCEGDGGGPLVCLNQKKDDTRDRSGTEFEDDPVFGFDLRGAELGDNVQLMQVGVTAWGIECGQTGLPSVYTNLAEISNRCWLDQVISCYQETSDYEDYNLRTDYDSTPRTCSPTKPSDYDYNLRSDEDDCVPPVSEGQLQQSQCAGWVESSSSGKASCGCKESLLPDTIDYDIRGATE